MGSPKHQPGESSLLLLDGIETLLAQVRWAAQIDDLKHQCAAQRQLLPKCEHTLERVKFEVASLEARLAQCDAATLAERQAAAQEAKLDRQTF